VAPSRSRKLRVTIVGHASPRWRSAATNADADRRNELLANQRADAVFAAVEQLLRMQLGQNVPIEKNVTLTPDMAQPGLMVSAHGEGSREALQDEHKDRSSDADYDRRVDLSIELVATEDTQGGVSLPAVQATSRLWSVTVNRLRVVRAIAAAGGIEVAIRNRKTGKEVLATAKLYGVGRPRLNPFATEEETGRKRVWFSTDYEIPIQDFEGTRIEVIRTDFKLVVGETVMGLSFPQLSHDGPTMYHHFGVGMPSGFMLWGDLHLWGDTSDDVNPTDVVTSTLDRRSNDSMTIVFPTGGRDIPVVDLAHLAVFVTTWRQRLGWP
jgi:hypothetical protein